MKSPEALRKQILELTEELASITHGQENPAFIGGADDLFIPGEHTVPYAGRVFGSEEISAAVGSVLDFWLTLGPEGEAFERKLAECLGVKRSLLVNSGSSANLLAMSALTSNRLKERALQPGDEVITVAAGFPTTVAPILQNRLVPVFIDNDPITLNAKVEYLEEAYQEGKTKAVMMAHTLGNPFDLKAITEFCEKYNLWLIEDNCDALGSLYGDQMTGSFGDLTSQSFYPPHHLTLGEGGAVNIRDNMLLKVLVESFRDWGRDCWCPSGKDNTCCKRFGWQLGELPKGYDHKYIYSHFGYNIKPLDIQAAIGRVQIERLDEFSALRRENWKTLRRGLDSCSEFIDFVLPTHASGWDGNDFTWDEGATRVDPSWFGFMLMVKEDAPFTKVELAKHLDEKKIGNRMLFGGNLLRQPAFVDRMKAEPDSMRVIGEMAGADEIMNRALFIGVYPGLTSAMLEYVIEVITDFVGQKH
ncbi:MAG: lipopolysaccharide biosynthesis protein RfbH [Verrucomicrobiota bacterium]